MKGCRPLPDLEIAAVRTYLAGRPAAARNLAILELGLRTGFRITQLLSLDVADVFREGRIASSVYAARRNVKNQREGQRLPLHPAARAALERLLGELVAAGRAAPDAPLFQSRKGGRRLDRRSAWEMLKGAVRACAIEGKVATHSMRKTFARRMRKAVGGDLFKLQKLLGHADIQATIKYLDDDEAELEAAVLTE